MIINKDAEEGNIVTKRKFYNVLIILFVVTMLWLMPWKGNHNFYGKTASESIISRKTYSIAETAYSTTDNIKKKAIEEENMKQESTPIVVNEVIEEVAVTESSTEDEVLESIPSEENYIEPQTVTGGFVGTYDITAYTWTGNVMANGEFPYYGCAASCDFPLGTTLHIEGVGTFVVNDVCPSSGVIDVYMDSYDECINFGRISANVYIQ